ncbi:hypothetical protein FB45DRAFT_926729 [Roridomyces roridus]|uniref:Uncharacterized protein n=1 Tax=Roridomyces roridus TaxID=1738132 RepID=A0AAD7BKY1_9AGAR|nr:hypothetical protein FB45DRAFT_926729 [Roridomyces roridus]
MTSLLPTRFSHSAEEISTCDLVGEDDLARAGTTMTHNMRFMGHALQQTCSALKRMEIPPDPAVRVSLQQIGAELVRLADAAEQLFVYVFDLYRASLEPPVPISLGAEALALIDSCLVIIQNSARVVHSACRDNALPCALYNAYNPIPILYQYFSPVPPAVMLWKELGRFTDICMALDRLLPAILTLRSVVRQAVDERAVRFIDNRQMMEAFFTKALGTVDSACSSLSVNARGLWCYATIPGVASEPLHDDQDPRGLFAPKHRV